MPLEASVPAHLADGAQDGDGAQLLQEVRVAQQGALKCGRLAGRKMRPNGLDDSRDLALGKAELFQNGRRVAGGVGHVVPGRQGHVLLGAVADEDAKIMHPGGDKEDVVVVGLVFRQPGGQVIKPGLMAEFVRRLRLGADVVHDSLSAGGFVHGGSIAGPRGMARWEKAKSAGACRIFVKKGLLFP